MGRCKVNDLDFNGNKMEYSTSKIDKLKKKHKQLHARIQKLETSQKNKEKKQDTRRKILVGAYYLDKAKKENKMDEIRQAMEKFLTRKSDRVLFELELGNE